MKLLLKAARRSRTRWKGEIHSFRLFRAGGSTMDSSRPAIGMQRKLALFFVMMLAGPSLILGQTFFKVTGTGDGSSTTISTGGGSSGSPYQIASLRGALLYIDANAGTASPAIINLPAGTITLTSSLQAAESGNETITINGDPTSGTTINGANSYVTLSIDYSTTGGTNVTVNKVTLTSGKDGSDGYGGAGILDGTGFTTPPLDVLTLSNCTISNCHSTQGDGGAIAMWGGTVTITNCTFSSNSVSEFYGGAIFFTTGGTMSITGSTFTGNSATATSSSYPGSGGAIYFSGSGTGLTVSNTSFTSNTVTDNYSSEGSGGAIWINSGGISLTRCSFTGNSASSSSAAAGGALFAGAPISGTVSYSRFHSNTATTSGYAIEAGTSASITANNNWWGSNSGPGSSDIHTSGGASVTASTFLELEMAPARTTIGTDDSTLLTADLLARNSGGPITASNLSGLPTFGSSFGSPVLGTLSNSTQFVNGIATTVYSAGATGGTGSAQVTADAQTVTLNPTITVIPAPTVITNSATGISTSGATLNGSVNANGGSSTVKFYYGLTTAYGDTVTATQSPVSGSSSTPVSKSITGLAPNTMYHYVVSATNIGGSSSGHDSTFTTIAALATVSTDSASAITGTAATLYGTVNANNSPTTVMIEYGPTASYGNSVTADQSPVTGTANTLVSAHVTGLSPLTMYHYRIDGTNGGGTSNGTDMTFTTTDASLAVEMSSFTAGSDPGSVTLTWKTQSELRNAGFNVMRRDPGMQSYKTISSFLTNNNLVGLGTSAGGRTYSFIDSKVLSGKT